MRYAIITPRPLCGVFASVSDRPASFFVCGSVGLVSWICWPPLPSPELGWRKCACQCRVVYILLRFYREHRLRYFREHQRDNRSEILEKYNAHNTHTHTRHVTFVSPESGGGSGGGGGGVVRRQFIANHHLHTRTGRPNASERALSSLLNHP